MLFKEFVLHNFGIYRGRHAVNLETKPGRPIILFGALNGSGKTTFLDGLQLVLYGKQARCSGRGNMAYPDFLRSCVNSHVAPSEGASLELEFCHHHEGRWQTIRVARTWTMRNESVREKLEVWNEGTLDSVLSERWAEYVEDFIPSQISELFFFDGEKIEGLAEESSAAAILRTGIHALLGLDVVDRLSADLKVIQRRRRIDSVDASTAARLTAKQKELGDLEREKEDLTQAAGAHQVRVDDALKKANLAKDLYHREGGEMAEQGAAVEARLEKLKEEKKLHDGRLMDLAAGTAPVLLVSDLLAAAQAQAVREQGTVRARQLLDEFSARDRLVLEAMTRAESSAAVIEKVAASLEEDRAGRARQASQPVYLQVDPARLDGFSLDALSTVRAEIVREAEHARALIEQINHCERTLAGTPGKETLAPLLKAYNELKDSHQREIGALAFIRSKLDDVARAFERVDREFRGLMEREAQVHFKSETNARVLDHIARVEITLKQYRDKILAKNLERLSYLILACFELVTRKRHMFSRIDISPSDYRLSLIDGEGRVVPSYRLSAGERQLLAVSILWGLSRASGRPLPAIIDTPLGRLDGKHRTQLVKNYFPLASHQVILLSTDKEIDENLRQQLGKKVAREYLIEFDETKLTSAFHEGYFGATEAVQ